MHAHCQRRVSTPRNMTLLLYELVSAADRVCTVHRQTVMVKPAPATRALRLLTARLHPEPAVACEVHRISVWYGRCPLEIVFWAGSGRTTPRFVERRTLELHGAATSHACDAAHFIIFFIFPLGSRRPFRAAHAHSNARRAGVAVMQAPRGGRTVAVTLPGCHHPVRRTAPSRVSCWPAARRFAGGCRLRQDFLAVKSPRDTMCTSPTFCLLK